MNSARNTHQNKIMTLMIELALVIVGLGLLVSGVFDPARTTDNGLAQESMTITEREARGQGEERSSTGIAPRSIEPARFLAPSIDIDAPISAVGKNRVGNMAAPEDYDTVAWYQPGFAPGEQGNAVLAGHLDNGLGLAGVFQELDELEKGDEFSVIGQDGTKLTFRVSDRTVYDYRKAPVDKIFGENEKSQVKLITCGGQWLEQLNTYRDRTVITGEFVEIDASEDQELNPNEQERDFGRF